MDTRGNQSNQSNQPSRRPKAKHLDRLVTLPIFYIHDSNKVRTIIHRTAVLDIEKLICVTPANYSYGYGPEEVVSTEPYTVRYPHEIPKSEYVELHFSNGAFFNMMSRDFEDCFRMPAPKDIPE